MDLSSAPPDPRLLALRMDNSIGKVLSGNLVLFLRGLAKACSTIAEEKYYSQVQTYMKKVFFEEGYQELRLRVLDQSSTIEILYGKNDRGSFPQASKFADLDALLRFFPRTAADAAGKDVGVNELRFGACLCGMPPIEVISNKIRRVISIGTDEGKAFRYPYQMPKIIIAALNQTFPNGNQFLSELIDMDTIEIKTTPSKGRSGMLFQILGDINVEKLEELYPSIANFLNHAQELELTVMDHDTKDNEMESGKCMTQFRIFYEAGNIVFRFCCMLSSVGGENGALLWYNMRKNECFLKPDGNIWEVEFAELEPSKTYTFRIFIKSSIRLVELGCGSITLPLVVAEMKITSSEGLYPHLYPELERKVAPAHRIEFKIVQIASRSWTTYLIRPFFNTELFRYFLTNNLHIQIDFIPSNDKKYDFFSNSVAVSINDRTLSIRPGHWSLVIRIGMIVLPTSGLMKSFLRTFAEAQLQTSDDLLLFWKAATALERDMMLMHGRLCRAEGNQPEFSLKDEHQTAFRRNPPVKKKTSLFRCCIS